MKRLLDHAVIEETLPAPRVEMPRLGSLDTLDFPVNVPVHSKPTREEVLDSSEGLDELTELAIDKVKEILKLDLEPGDDNFGAVLRQQASVSIGVLTTQVRVDEGRFKKKQVDKLGELLDLIKGEEAKQVVARVLN